MADAPNEKSMNGESSSFTALISLLVSVKIKTSLLFWSLTLDIKLGMMTPSILFFQTSAMPSVSASSVAL